MRIWHWVIVAFLLLKLSANAQQSANPATSASTASVSATSSPATTMDQVVDRAGERDHALIEMLKTRTPFVETYLQDLKFRPQEGPAPAQDHYFLGRMDLSESMSRRDYLAKDTSFETRIVGVVT